MGKKKVVLDTNILISAFGWEGKPKEILGRVLNNEFELIMSKKQLEELTRVLEYPKFGFTEDQKLRFIAIITEVATIIETSNALNMIKDDPSDNIILESAMECGAEFLVSGDDHLLSLKEYNGVKIVTASEFLKLNI